MDFDTGAFGVGGGETGTVRIVFHGRLGQSFIDFVQNRAARLSLSGWVLDGTSVNVVLAGPSALIDAFEIACSLGPIDSQIEGWERTDVSGMDAGKRTNAIPLGGVDRKGPPGALAR